MLFWVNAKNKEETAQYFDSREAGEYEARISSRQKKRLDFHNDIVGWCWVK